MNQDQAEVLKKLQPVLDELSAIQGAIENLQGRSHWDGTLEFGNRKGADRLVDKLQDAHSLLGDARLRIYQDVFNGPLAQFEESQTAVAGAENRRR